MACDLKKVQENIKAISELLNGIDVGSIPGNFPQFAYKFIRASEIAAQTHTELQKRGGDSFPLYGAVAALKRIREPLIHSGFVFAIPANQKVFQEFLEQQVPRLKADIAGYNTAQAVGSVQNMDYLSTKLYGLFQSSEIGPRGFIIHLSKLPLAEVENAINQYLHYYAEGFNNSSNAGDNGAAAYYLFGFCEMVYQMSQERQQTVFRSSPLPNQDIINSYFNQLNWQDRMRVFLRLRGTGAHGGDLTLADPQILSNCQTKIAEFLKSLLEKKIKEMTAQLSTLLRTNIPGLYELINQTCSEGSNIDKRVLADALESIRRRDEGALNQILSAFSPTEHTSLDDMLQTPEQFNDESYSNLKAKVRGFRFAVYLDTITDPGSQEEVRKWVNEMCVASDSDKKALADALNVIQARGGESLSQILSAFSPTEHTSLNDMLLTSEQFNGESYNSLKAEIQRFLKRVTEDIERQEESTLIVSSRTYLPSRSIDRRPVILEPTVRGPYGNPDKRGKI